MRLRCIFALVQTQSATTNTLIAGDWATAPEKSRRSLSAKLNQWDALHVNGVINIQKRIENEINARNRTSPHG